MESRRWIARSDSIPYVHCSFFPRTTRRRASQVQLNFNNIIPRTFVQLLFPIFNRATRILNLARLKWNFNACSVSAKFEFWNVSSINIYRRKLFRIIKIRNQILITVNAKLLIQHFYRRYPRKFPRVFLDNCKKFLESFVKFEFHLNTFVGQSDKLK